VEKQALPPVMLDLLEQRSYLGQYLFHDLRWQGVYLAGIAGGKVYDTWLIATDDAGSHDVRAWNDRFGR